jgi:hypothetical protein
MAVLPDMSAGTEAPHASAFSLLSSLPCLAHRFRNDGLVLVTRRRSKDALLH